MNSDMYAHVTDLLKSFRQREQRIELLRYELLHHANVSGDELIDNLNFSTEDTAPNASGNIFYIMLNYQKFADRLNTETVNEIVAELVDLEKEQDRLHYYVSLLDSREAQVIRRVYFEGCSWEQAAEELGVVCRTVHKIKERALNNLAWMYGYTDSFGGNHAPTAH